MVLLRKRISIPPNHIGYLYKKNRLKRTLNAGIYYVLDWWWEVEYVAIPLFEQLITITNQEILTQDNIALRISYIVQYQITQGEVLINKVDVFSKNPPLMSNVLTIVHNLSQVYLRNAIAKINSQDLNQNRGNILQQIPESLQIQLEEFGIRVNKLIIKDICFPKPIQKLFATELEAKIRAKADLENARTAVASARALKNAAKLMENDSNLKFIQYLETITKIASQGNHTFHLGEFPQNQRVYESDTT